MSNISNESKQTEQSFKWKKRFIILGAVNVAILLTIGILLFWPVQESKLPKKAEPEGNESSEFIVRTTKENLNELVNAYLDNLLEGSNHHYEISLDKDVHLMGELPVFSSTVPLSVHLEPIVQDDGNVILKINSISVGLLELPNKRILSYLDDYLPTPDWVVINPKREEIYVQLTEMDIKSNFHVRAETIDIEANNIAFKFFIPYETLGIETKED